MENRSESIGKNLGQSESIYGIFKNRMDSKKALALILNRGYKLDEIEIYPKEMGGLIPNPNIHHHPTGDEFMQDSIKWLKKGAIFGIISSFALVGISLMIMGKNENSSIFFSFLTSIFVGAIWGGMLGFFIGPHLPSPIWKFLSKSPVEPEVTFNFQAHNMVDAFYFAGKGGLRISS